MSDSDEYDYAYSDDSAMGGSDDEVDEELVEIENTYYEADIKDSEPAKAVEMFERVVKLETDRGEEVKWRFQSLLALVQLHFQLGNQAAMIERYEELFKYMSSATSNEQQEAIQKVLDTVSASTEVGMLSQVYEITLRALKMAKNDRLWFSTLVKKGRLLARAHDWPALAPLVRELHDACTLPDGSDDPSKGNNLMEMYALDIQLATALRDRRRMKIIYDKVQGLNSAVNDPRINGIVHRTFGLMRMSEGNWTLAYEELYTAFTNYQEAGSREAPVCLKYLVLCSVMNESVVDPFDDQHAQVYKGDAEVKAMATLSSACQNNDIALFDSVIKDRRNKIASDEVIAPHLQELLRRVRSKVILRLVKPYSAVRLSFIAKELGIDGTMVESLLVQLILDGRLNGKIDQLRGLLLLHSSRSAKGMGAKTFTAVSHWTEHLEALRSQLGTTMR